VTSEPNGGYWQTGGLLIRIALLLPVLVGLLLGTSFASLAVESSATGLDANNRGWFFLMVPPVQLVTSVWATAYLASLYFGLAALPPLAGRSASAAGPVMKRSDTLDGSTRPREAITALGLAVGGTVAVILAVPVQVVLSTWLITRPDLYSDVERVIVGVETAALTLWLAYLVRGLWRSRHAAPRYTRSQD
jgi:hypothetical protein